MLYTHFIDFKSFHLSCYFDGAIQPPPLTFSLSQHNQHFCDNIFMYSEQHQKAARNTQPSSTQRLVEIHNLSNPSTNFNNQLITYYQHVSYLLRIPSSLVPERGLELRSSEFVVNRSAI